MGIEGRLTIDLDRGADGTGRATIASSRPLKFAQAFIGKAPDDVVRTLPLVFSVCGLAQGAAAAQACERALGIAAEPETRCIRRLLVHVETLREHLVRAVMDWPRLLGCEPQTADMLRVLRLCAGIRRMLDPGTTALTIGGTGRLDRAQMTAAIADFEGLIEALVLAEPIAAWQARRDVGDIDVWSKAPATPSQRLVRTVLDRGWGGAGRAEMRFLPSLADGELARRLLDEDCEDFIAAPTWDGAPCETSALSRQAESPLVRELMGVYGAGLLIRIIARLVEIAETPRLMRAVLEARADEQEAASAGCGRGLAQVEAARGRLVHSVEIEDNVVRRYAILAPTEWNFHGQGGAARGLAEIAGRDRNVSEVAELFVTAVDPCVGFELRVH